MDEAYDRLQANDRRVLVALTVSWEGILDDEQPLPCTPEHADSLYRTQEWVAQQAMSFVFSLTNHMGQGECFCPSPREIVHLYGGEHLNERHLTPNTRACSGT